MKTIKTFALVSVLTIGLTASAFASWWNPFTWNFFKKQTSVTTQQVAVDNSLLVTQNNTSTTTLETQKLNQITSTSSDVLVASTTEFIKTNISIPSGYVQVPFTVKEDPFLSGGYSGYFDTSKQSVVNNYSIKLYSDSKMLKGNDYLLIVFLNDIKVKNGASVRLLNVKCEGNIEIRADSSDNICRSKGTNPNKFYPEIDDQNNIIWSGLSSLHIVGEGNGKIYIEVLVTVPVGVNKKDVVVLHKGVTFTINASTNADKGSLDSRNVKRQNDIKSIFTALTQLLEDDNGNFPSSITSIPKEICATGATSCEGFADLSVLNGVYLTRIPLEYGKLNTDGAGYKVSKSGDVITVSAQYPEGGKIIQISCNYKKGC